MLLRIDDAFINIDIAADYPSVLHISSIETSRMAEAFLPGRIIIFHAQPPFDNALSIS